MLRTSLSRLVRGGAAARASAGAAPLTRLGGRAHVAALAPAARRALPLLRGARAMATTTPEALGLEEVGVRNKGVVHHNLSYEEIYEHEVRNGEGWATSTGAFCVDTGKFTGRSPRDKWIVHQLPSEANFDWGEVNQELSPEVFEELHALVARHYASADDIYVFDGYCGANPSSRKNVRFVTELAWQHHFVTNMFIRPEAGEVGPDTGFRPDFTIINACRTEDPDWERHGLNSPVFVAFNVEKRLAVIGGTWYGGEMKKGIFSMMNYWLPLDGIMAMHCSANVGPKGDTALFFGLSGTGKTTLSADPKRFLIGDDEHGWDDDGIFNFEGGCYAKTIDLSPENEPEIYAAIKRNALLENVSLKGEDNTPDYSDTSKTENGRVSYPIEHIPNFHQPQMAGHPENIIFLTCDAYGVLPPVSRLDPDQAMYHFLSGYTAKVAGTERGITEPVATFSACFGAAFMPLHPTRYADLLKEKMRRHNTHAWLVNTGWTGGPYGTGRRIDIPSTRACIDAILDGSIRDAKFVHDERFNFDVPVDLPGVPAELLSPRTTWADGAEYDAMADTLARMFVDNFEKYRTGGTDYAPYGPRV